ncbi:hypothetical protein PSW42_11530 [Yersinia pestis]|nr:hypothetical protein [Yersinia pestis]
MEADKDIYPEIMGNAIVIGKTGSGKTTFMSAILEQCITRKIEIGDTTELKFPQNKGKGKRRGKK